MTERDLELLAISAEAVDWFRSREALLGMTPETYQRFIETLSEVLKRDGISYADVRAMGSSARFFSGAHKPFPASRGELLDVWAEEQGALPSPTELDAVEDLIEGSWPDGVRPGFRPFDSLYRLGLSMDMSDYDVQVSSDEIYERASEAVSERLVPVTDLRVRHPQYAFVKKYIVEEVCPYLTIWAIEQSHELARNVTVAVFPSAGPDRQATGPSSHHQTTDWLLP